MNGAWRIEELIAISDAWDELRSEAKSAGIVADSNSIPPFGGENGVGIRDGVTLLIGITHVLLERNKELTARIEALEAQAKGGE